MRFPGELRRRVSPALFIGGLILTATGILWQSSIVVHAAARAVPREVVPNFREAFGGANEQLDRPAVVIYVARWCRHCHAELERWASMLAENPQLRQQIQIGFVILGGVGPDSSWIQTLRPELVMTGRSELLAQMAIRAVPTVDFVTPTLAILDRASGGQTPAASLSRLVALVNHGQNGEAK